MRHLLASLAWALLAWPSLAHAQAPLVWLEPGARVVTQDFGEPLRDAIPVPPLFVTIGARGGIGGVDPTTGLTRWKIERPGLRRWAVEGDDLVLEGDSLERLRLAGGEALWALPLGCEGGACSLHVLARDADTVWLGGIGPRPDQLMLIDARSGREMWPQWLPLGAPVQSAQIGDRRLLVVLDEAAAGARIVALSPGSGLAAWRSRPEDGRPRAVDVLVADLGDLACLSYPAEGVRGARTLDVIDARTGDVRISRTVLDASAASLLCLPGATGTFRIAAPGRVDALSRASLATLASLPLPGSARGSVRVAGATWLLLDAGLVRVRDDAPVPEPPLAGPLAPTCEAHDDRVTCPDRVLLLGADGASPRVASPAPGERLVQHSDVFLGVEDGSFRVYTPRPGPLSQAPAPVLTPRPGGL